MGCIICFKFSDCQEMDCGCMICKHCSGEGVQICTLCDENGRIWDKNELESKRLIPIFYIVIECWWMWMKYVYEKKSFFFEIIMMFIWWNHSIFLISSMQWSDNCFPQLQKELNVYLHLLHRKHSYQLGLQHNKGSNSAQYAKIKY